MTSQDQPFVGGRPPFSVAILAGGRSERMMTDKAFLSYDGSSFISRIAREASKVSDDVLVVIGDKGKERFESDLDARVRVVGDSHHLAAPLGGMLTAFELLQGRYLAVVGCDSPLLKGEMLWFLHSSALGRSAAVPLWASGKIEPLCAVYRRSEAREAGLKAVEAGRLRCRDMLALLSDVNYVPVSELRGVDPTLSSLVNVNTPADLDALRGGPRTRMLPLRAAAALPTDE